MKKVLYTAFTMLLCLFLGVIPSAYAEETEAFSVSDIAAFNAAKEIGIGEERNIYIDTDDFTYTSNREMIVIIDGKRTSLGNGGTYYNSVISVSVSFPGSAWAKISVTGVGEGSSKIVLNLFSENLSSGATNMVKKTYEYYVGSSGTPTPEPTTYTVTYNANGGSGAPASQTKTKGSPITLSSVRPAKADNIGYKITLNANGGSVSASSIGVGKTTYTFKNWNTALNGSGTSYNPGASYTTDANLTLYAQWDTTIVTETVMLPTPTREGWVFKGWATSSNDLYGIIGSYTPTANVTLYATWECAGKYDSYDGRMNWVIDNRGCLTISGSGPVYNYGWSDKKDYIKTIVIKEGMTRIDDWCFEDCNNLTNVSIPNTVYSIGYSAFQNCTNLSGIVIPDSVTTIQNSTFYKCSNLKYAEIPTSVTRIQNYAFAWCSNLKVELPPNLTEIGESAFYLCSSITELSIPDGVASIPDSCFSQCTGLTNVTIPGNVKSIDKKAFYLCNEIKNVTIMEGVERIGSYAFSGCTKLNTISIPMSLTKIEQSAFNDTSALRLINYGGTQEQWNAIDIRAYNDTLGAATIYYQNKYTVTYNANGGTGAPASQTKTQGTALTLSSTRPTRASSSAGSYTVTLNANGGSVSTTSLTAARTTNYTFKNWNTSSNGSGTSYNPGASYTANASLTLYAQWNSSTTTVSVTLPTPTRSGYTFKGWAASSSASSGTTGSYTPSGNVTLYAIWQQSTTTNFTVTYNANGGSGAPANQTKTQGTALTLSSTRPTRASSSAGSYTVTLNANGGSVSPTSLTAARTTNYTFKNWNTASNGSGTSYNPGASYTANANLTLYAQWNSSTTTASVTLPTPTRSGYTFKGWATGSSASSGTTGSYTPTKNVTLYAIWQADTGAISISKTNFPDDNFRTVVQSFDTNHDGSLSSSEINAVTEIACARKSIKSLQGIAYFTKLQELYCGINEIEALDLSKNTALTRVSCIDNKLSALDVSMLPKLADLSVNGNNLQTLNTRNNPLLESLDCSDNQLKGLDLSQNRLLSGLFCSGNQITVLDISGCPELVRVVEENVPKTGNDGKTTYGYSLYTDEGVRVVTEPGEVSGPDFILPASLTRIEDEAFEYGAFSYVLVPDGVQYIGRRAFAYCPNLTYIYIPESAAIDAHAFDGVSDLTIIGKAGGKVSTFAKSYGFTFVPAA